MVWVGTGERNAQRSVAYGDGVYRSDDGGRSWTNVGLKTSEHIGRVVVHPTDSETLYVAAQIAATSKAPAALFSVRDALQFVPTAQFGMPGKGFQGETFYTGDNPPLGALIT